MITEPTRTTPKMLKEVVQQATPSTLSQVRCPVCGHSYSKKMKDGSIGLFRPCKHLVAHLGTCGWEKAPSKAVNLTSGYYAAKAFATLAAQGTVTHVTSGENDCDHDWLVWQKPTQTTTLVRLSDVAPLFPVMMEHKAA